MKIAIVYAHPSAESFNHSLLEAFKSGIKEAGHEADVIDLYADGFDPVLTFSEQGSSKELVVSYQEKIKEADHLAFIFPTWWYRPPAILEGFLDQVFSQGFAFKYLPSLFGFIPRVKGLLPVKKIIVMETYGGPSWYYRYLICQLPWKRLRLVFRFCGVRKFLHVPCYAIRPSNKSLKAYLERAKKIGRKLK